MYLIQKTNMKIVKVFSVCVTEKMKIAEVDLLKESTYQTPCGTIHYWSKCSEFGYNDACISSGADC